MEGDNTPYGYSSVAREHGEAMRAVSSDLTFCSSGPYPSKDWAEHSARVLRDIASLVSLHYYAPERKFTLRDKIEDDYKVCISSVEDAREAVRTIRSQLGKNIRISFDEWNVWYAWYRPSCVADGMEKGTYIRVSGSTRPAELEQIKEMFYESEGRSYDCVIRKDMRITDKEIDKLCQMMKDVASANCKNDIQRSQLKTISKNVLLSWGVLLEEDGNIY